MKDSEPTELVSCGKCKTINTVPFGLEKFKCYECGVIVSIAREPSAACAAASSTALLYTETPESQANSTASSGGGAQGSGAGNAGGGFFGKLQKTMDKTMAKVNKTIENLTTDKPPGSDVLARPGGGPGSEEEQLQWALSASFTDAKPAVSAAAADEAPLSPGDQLQVAAAQAAHRLQAAEARAERAERELAAAQAQETAAAAERKTLRRQLDENEALIKGLTDKLDLVNAQLERQHNHCKALENSLTTAREANSWATQEVTRRAQDTVVDEEDEIERQGTISQLLARIGELEAQLLRATHFAPEASSADHKEEGVTEAAEVVERADDVKAANDMPAADSPSATATALAPSSPKIQRPAEAAQALADSAAPERAAGTAPPPTSAAAPVPAVVADATATEAAPAAPVATDTAVFAPPPRGGDTGR